MENKEQGEAWIVSKPKVLVYSMCNWRFSKHGTLEVNKFNGSQSSEKGTRPAHLFIPAPGHLLVSPGPLHTRTQSSGLQFPNPQSFDN